MPLFQLLKQISKQFSIFYSLFHIFIFKSGKVMGASTAGQWLIYCDLVIIPVSVLQIVSI
jgi:hypothetical protein